MTRSQTRRRYLAAAGTGTLAAIAGCTGFGDDAESEEDQGLDNNTPGDAATEGNVDDVDYENPPGSVAFARPKDGDTVTNPVQFEINVEDFEVEPTSENPNDGAGHMHVIVDEGFVAPGQPIPQEEAGYHHLGEGQTETEIELESGEHDLYLQAGDSLHVAYDLGEEISVTVEEGSDGNETDSGGNETDGGNESNASE